MSEAVDQDVRKARRERIEGLKKALYGGSGRRPLSERIAQMQEFLTVLAGMPADSIGDEFDIQVLREWLWILAVAGGFFTRSGGSELARYLKVLEPHFVGAPSSYFRPGFVRLVLQEIAAGEALEKAQQQPALAGAPV